MRAAGPQISPIDVQEDNSYRIEYDRERDVTTFMSTEGLDVSFKIRVLADCLICRLCNGFFRTATTIKECLHTFCRTCILKYLISVKSNCPKCQTTIEGNLLDGLVIDQRLQNLVDKLFPSYRVNDLRMRAAFWSYLGRYADDSTSKLVDHAEPNGPVVFHIAPKDIAIHHLKSKTCVKTSIFPDPECPFASKIPRLKRPFMIISADIPIKLLCNFIASLLQLEKHASLIDNKKHIELWLTGRYVPLTHTLDFACRSRRFAIGTRGNIVPFLYRIAYFRKSS